MSANIVELPCPLCGQIHRVPEHELRGGGELSCAACGERIEFRVAPRGVTQPSRISTGERRFEAERPPPQEPLRQLERWDDAAGTARDVPLRTGARGEATRDRTADRLVCCPNCRHVFDPAESAPARRVVLVVESADYFLHLATEVLGRRYTAIGVRTAAEARRVLATRPVDLVLTDLYLPDGDGRDVMNSLPRPGIPVVVLSGRDETHLLGEAWDELRRLGARDLVQKAINMEDALAQKVDRLLAAPAR